jgi:hypothetical protein
MRALLIWTAVALLSPSVCQAQRINWDQPLAVLAPEDVSLSLALGGETHFGFSRAWVSAGRSTPEGSEVSSTQVAIERERLQGFLVVRDGLGKIGFEETTAQARLKNFAYWRDRNLTPRRAGLFVHGVGQGAINVRWILFPHTDAAGAAHECAAFVGNGAAAKIEMAGYWCVNGARPATEAELQGFFAAIGYKDILAPKPMGTPPGR